MEIGTSWSQGTLFSISYCFFGPSTSIPFYSPLTLPSSLFTYVSWGKQWGQKAYGSTWQTFHTVTEIPVFKPTAVFHHSGSKFSIQKRKLISVSFNTAQIQMTCKSVVQFEATAHKRGNSTNTRNKWYLQSFLSGFGGFGTQVRGLKPGQSRRIFQGEKNPQHAFLRKGRKAVCLMS